ncbi:GNAT family N-acetyltransferase [Sporosarcina sp. E16_8]|uniref:GNAT family N-acetyltransferase n=1 Tax=Sporosarcina sp. E16_8 TaxID=2789295 RepID=UPI001A931636|nr:GNAT family N-acetyltransferase [Sporosarcina sp. E16_8]MBO0587254.1 GNAT family N-acetyltransferase [Sporosarcina sp. E16_8]
MNWYEKLNEYFPVEEMKSKEHMDALLTDKMSVYKKDEGPHHVLMYVEFEKFIFVDYLFVSTQSRGMGLGGKLLTMLKAKNKPILLEVEPVDYEDTDTAKRLKFYSRENFTHAQRIGYNRRSLATGENTVLEILYWSPTHSGEEEIYNAMTQTYDEIHTYKDETFYGKKYDPTHEVLVFHTKGKRDILQPFDTLE